MPLYRRLPKRGLSLLSEKYSYYESFSLQKFHDNKKIDLKSPIDLNFYKKKK